MSKQSIEIQNVAVSTSDIPKKKRKKREKEELQKIVHALVQRNLIIIKIMDSLKNAGHAEVALFFESFRAPFYKKKKNREERMEKKKRKEYS